ncbi:MAG: class I SAM-dependent RNA methyltransferase [Desulfosarcina sp.]|nr:class I SAM-dependent RNA methyltransferase [Desulfosarcina sp.]MBC2741896.1 class I SAM-dependent RNA methyltransferase [Desulfosarcina sp.]MBC2764809.1 class I SAM-dependent RNA methyltransferase [Desulfosarcina sp.]
MVNYQKKDAYFAQIADGLEAAGVDELVELGAVNARPIRRGIHFMADRATLYRINYCTRLCTRVLAPIKSFVCPDAAAIYRAARSIDWPRFFSLEQTFAVFTSTAGSTVPHSQFAGLKLKDAVADHFRAGFGRRPNVDPRAPDLWINLHVAKDRGTISIDTSGGSLHRRGYRSRSVDAPMQETVAAAMVRLSGWDGRVPLADPMCGSGTLVIEAAMAYCRIPAGCLRSGFGFQHLPDYDSQVWKTVKDEVDNQIRKLPERLIYASDVNPQAVSATRVNCKMVPNARKVDVLRMDFTQIEQLENRIILCNPPYGIRMKGQESLDSFYRQLGDFLKQRCKGSEAYIYFGNREMIKRIGLKPSWKRPLRNGGLDGRLVKYTLY